MSGSSGFELIQDEADPKVVPHPATSTPSAAAKAHKVASDALILALTALSKRAFVALLRLFTLVTVGSVWWLCLDKPDPSITQLAQIGGYAAFILAINWMVHRR